MSDFPRQVVEGRTVRPRVGLVLGPQEGPGSLPLFNLNKCTQKKKFSGGPPRRPESSVEEMGFC